MANLQKITVFKENKIYFVTNEKLSLGRSDYSVIKEVIEAGVNVIQLRDKHASKKVLLQKALKIKQLIEKQKKPVIFIINDHLDIALASEADGVHLGQDDLPLLAAKKIIKKAQQKIIVGISTHNLPEALKAQKEGADYINIGPLFPTTTKENNYPPICLSGFSSLENIIKKIKIPFSVMGGIKQKHLADLFTIGVKTVAMITEITQQKNIKKHIQSLLQEST